MFSANASIDIPQIQQFLDGEPPYFTVPQIGIPNQLFFQTCTSIHNMHVFGIQQNTKGKKSRGEKCTLEG